MEKLMKNRTRRSLVHLVRMATPVLILMCFASVPRAHAQDASDKVWVIVHIDILGGPNLEKGMALMKQFEAESRKDPGVVSFDFVEETAHRNHFTGIEVWQNQQAFQAHEDADHTKRFRAAMFPLLGAPFDERPNHPYVFKPEENLSARVAVGKAFWQDQMCQFCHGVQGEGAWGPDLAGRGLTAAQIKRAVREPSGLMPAYTDVQVSDATIAGLEAFLGSLPATMKNGPWRWQSPPAGAPEGQRLQSDFGCGQCHEPEMAIVRRLMGAEGKDATFEDFAKQTYEHTEAYPHGRQGNYSKDRLPEADLRKIYDYVVAAGIRVPVAALLKPGAQDGANTTFTLTVFNDGVANKGLTAENLTIFIRIPPGTTAVGGTGTGYQGVHPLAQLGLAPAIAVTPGRFDSSKLPERPKPDLSGDVAVWKVPRIAAAEKQTYTLTLSGADSTPKFLDRFAGSAVYWTKPGARLSPSQMVYRDLRMPDKGDQVAIATREERDIQKRVYK
jgi:quinol monooxygenase YgiN